MAPAITHAPAAHFLQGCASRKPRVPRSEEHTSELQSQSNLVCRLLLEKKKNIHLTSLRHLPQHQQNPVYRKERNPLSNGRLMQLLQSKILVSDRPHVRGMNKIMRDVDF